MTVHVLGQLMAAVCGGAGVGGWVWMLTGAAKGGAR